jgi:hypothetical protein
MNKELNKYVVKMIRVKIIKPIADYNVGSTVEVITNINHTPLEKFWRDRLKDAKIDGCVEIVKKNPGKPVKKSNEVEK